MMTANGVKKSDSITIDLMSMVLLPNLLIPLLLKYSDTRDFSVEEKSELTDFENEIVLIKKALIRH